MFERRLKTFFFLIIGSAMVVLLRTAHVQVLESSLWQERSEKYLQRPEFLATTRGRILDCKGRELAADKACMVAAVDYRAIVRDPDWIRDQAIRRLRESSAEYRSATRQGRAGLIDREIARVNADIDNMWLDLARVSGRSPEEIHQIKTAIQWRVHMRRRYVWYRKYEQARSAQATRPSESFLGDWLLALDATPELDKYTVDVSEQFESHAILDNITPEVHNDLKKRLDRYPGLVLRPSKHRFYAYPYAESLCHVLGHLSQVSADDLRNDPNEADDLRRYYPNDLIGRAGLEALCEQTLRGARGQIDRMITDGRVVGAIDPVPGRDVRTSIDAELQLQIEQGFRDVVWPPNAHGQVERHEMHGAAVVIDVPTGQVRALVSYPTYDPNRYEELFNELRRDVLNKPLMNRATQLPLEPGSTVKPIVGIGAIADGLITVDHGIECTGYLVINGKRQPNGRCWTARIVAQRQLGEHLAMHHQMPGDAPHPTGFLNFTDAVQRSCNVYFENLGIRLGIDNLSRWYDIFGLGRKTGIGIPEWPGTLPGERDVPPGERASLAYFSAIGQVGVSATPIQMANVAATIARDGIWLRPRLVSDGSDADFVARNRFRDRVDLKLPPAAVAAAKEGMVRVINSRAGTGNKLREPDLMIAGKTGSAQAPVLTEPVLDNQGQPVLDANRRIVRRPVPVNDPRARWYRVGEHGELSHAWFIGYAPADRPAIAFAVMLEYGGGGGSDAGLIARVLLDACRKHGYLPPKPDRDGAG